MIEEPQKNQSAVLLGRMGKGRPKIISDSERQRRRLRMVALNAQRRGTITADGNHQHPTENK